jgi:hypothetical protein
MRLTPGRTEALLWIQVLSVAVFAVLYLVNPPRGAWFVVGVLALFAGVIGPGVAATVLLARGDSGPVGQANAYPVVLRFVALWGLGSLVLTLGCAVIVWGG